jgi:hypothetical protein
MIFLFAALFILILGGCASTDFQAWEGRQALVVEGRGGTKKIVDGMDVWMNGDPPRKFQVLGLVEDQRPGGIIPMAQLKHDVVRKVRQYGGNAAILISSVSQLRGYYSTATTNTNLYGSVYRGSYTGSATSFGSSTTVPLTSRASKFLVIKYLE